MVSLKSSIINTVPNCDCQKWIEYSDDNDVDILYTDTTCGETAYARGKGQSRGRFKIISYSRLGAEVGPTRTLILTGDYSSDLGKRCVKIA